MDPEIHLRLRCVVPQICMDFYYRLSILSDCRRRNRERKDKHTYSSYRLVRVPSDYRLDPDHIIRKQL